MSVRSSNSGRGGRGNSNNNNNGRGGRGRGGGGGRGQHYTGASKAKQGLCAALGTNVFDYGQKAAADQMKTSWEKLVQYVGTNHGQDISNELQNKQTVTVVEPTHTVAVLARHAAREAMVRAGQRNIQTARRVQETILEQAIAAGDAEAPMKLAILQNEIAHGRL